MRKASIVERSDAPPDEKASNLLKLVDEADLIRDRMESSFKRLSPVEVETLGPGRRKEIEQLVETMSKLKSKAKLMNPFRIREAAQNHSAAAGS